MRKIVFPSEYRFTSNPVIFAIVQPLFEGFDANVEIPRNESRFEEGDLKYAGILKKQYFYFFMRIVLG